MSEKKTVFTTASVLHIAGSSAATAAALEQIRQFIRTRHAYTLQGGDLPLRPWVCRTRMRLPGLGAR